MPTACPCGVPQPYEACCGRYHRGEPAPSAELLMRARYSAFAVGDEVYLLDTWHPSTRPRELRLDPGQRWVGLEVVRTEAGGIFDSAGVVEFRARYRVGRRESELRETSRFVREDGRWSYLGPVSLG